MSYSEESNIYTLTDFQVQNLLLSANGRIASFAVLEPAPEDDQEIRGKLEGYLRDVDDLLKMGLVEDISEEFSEQIAAKQGRDGRSYKVYVVSETGFLMFHDSGERVAN